MKWWKKKKAYPSGNKTTAHDEDSEIKQKQITLTYPEQYVILK